MSLGKTLHEEARDAYYDAIRNLPHETIRRIESESLSEEELQNPLLLNASGAYQTFKNLGGEKRVHRSARLSADDVRFLYWN